MNSHYQNAARCFIPVAWVHWITAYERLWKIHFHDDDDANHRLTAGRELFINHHLSYIPRVRSCRNKTLHTYLINCFRTLSAVSFFTSYDLYDMRQHFNQSTQCCRWRRSRDFLDGECRSTFPECRLRYADQQLATAAFCPLSFDFLGSLSCLFNLISTNHIYFVVSCTYKYARICTNVMELKLHESCFLCRDSPSSHPTTE